MNLEPHEMDESEKVDFWASESVLFSHAVDLVTPDVPVIESAQTVSQRIGSLFGDGPLTTMQVVKYYTQDWHAIPVKTVEAHLDQLRVDGFLAEIPGINAPTRWVRAR